MIEYEKKALVTGASRGIGKAIAKMLAAQKFDLYLTCRENSNQLETLGQSLQQQYGINCCCYTFSIADEKIGRAHV